MEPNKAFATSIATTVCFSTDSSFSLQEGGSGTAMPIETQGGVHSINEPDEVLAGNDADVTDAPHVHHKVTSRSHGIHG